MSNAALKVATSTNALEATNCKIPEQQEDLPVEEKRILFKELVSLFKELPLSEIRGSTTLSNGMSAAAFCSMQMNRILGSSSVCKAPVRLDELVPELKNQVSKTALRLRAFRSRKNENVTTTNISETDVQSLNGMAVPNPTALAQTGNKARKGTLLPHYSFAQIRQLLGLIRNTQNMTLDLTLPNGATMGDFVTQYVYADKVAALKRDERRRNNLKRKRRD